MKINIIVGTESGESEMVANDISAALGDRHEVTVQDMSKVDVDVIDTSVFHLVVCSTYGDGELPTSAKPFHAALTEKRPDLSALRYAVLGRGDQTYANTYSRGSEIINELLLELGATRVGEYGRDDAGDFDAPLDRGVVWAEEVVASVVADADQVSR
ncbi:MAG: flavodoxin domain-containing protein [Mycetocola sp.]